LAENDCYKKRKEKRMNMKIVMLNPPYFPMFSRSSRSPAVTKSSTLYYPFFLSYATGVLEDDGFDVTLIDAPAAGFNRQTTIEEIKELAPALVVCETTTPSIDNDMEVVRAIKEIDVPFVVAVGTHVSALPDEVLQKNSCLDVVARREYEYTIRDLVRLLEKQGLNGDLGGIRGISFRKDGKVKHNPDRKPIENLDKLPYVSRVYRDHLRPYINSYFYGANLHPVVSILSGRGCPHRCAYCVYPQTMTGNRYRLRSVANLVDELEFIKNELPEVKEIFLEDDTLTVNRKRAQAISQEIIDRKLKITWSTNSRADVDYETMRIMHQAGCRLLCVGFESASQEVLDRLGKHIKREQYFEFRKNAAKAGLLIHGCFMYGNEGETRETMRQTLEMAKKLNCDTSQFYPIMVYPGTRAYNNYKKRGFIKAQQYRDWLTPEGTHNCVVSLPNISSDALVNFCDLSRREFYFRPSYILSKVKQIIVHPSESKRILRAFKTLWKHLLNGSFRKDKS
jgi:radical SAM superfamily enzyme YgiQ (UPF0313 family)